MDLIRARSQSKRREFDLSFGTVYKTRWTQQQWANLVSMPRETSNNESHSVSGTHLPCESRLHRHIAGDVVCKPGFRSIYVNPKCTTTDPPTMKHGMKTLSDH